MFLLLLPFLNMMFGGENDPLMMVQQLRMFHQFGQAKEILDKMIDEKGEDTDVMIYRLRAECLINLDKPEEALEDIDSAMRIGPDVDENKNLNMLLASCHIKLGNPEEALEAAKESGDDNLISQTTEMGKIFKEVERLYDEGKKAECAKTIDKILSACSHSTYLMLKRCELAWDLGQTKVYEERAKGLLDMYKDDTELYFRYGVSLMCNGKFSEGKRILLRVKTMPEPPTNISEYNTIAANSSNYISQIKRYIDKNEISKANTALDNFNETVNKVCPANSGIMAKAYFYRGKILANENQTDDSIEFLNKAIEIDQENTEFILFRANILLKNKDYDAAIFDYTRLQRLKPHDSTISRALQKAQEEKKQAQRVDYYAILNVSKGCSQTAIKDSYRKLARKWHPDQYPKDKRKDAEVMMKKINTAYEVLSDPGKRKYYDNGGDMEQYQPGMENSPFTGGAGGVDPMDIIRTMFGQAAGGGGGGQQFIFFQQR
jgi:tetratricopeptide (TPR) repeat protein